MEIDENAPGNKSQQRETLTTDNETIYLLADEWLVMDHLGWMRAMDNDTHKALLEES